MTLFELLAILSDERFPFKLEYIGWNQSIEVTIDTFSKTEVYTVNEKGIVEHRVFQEVSSTEDESDIALSLESLINRPERTWITASKDLNIRFISPYVFIGTNGKEYEAMGLLPEFGFGKGVLLTSRKTDEIFGDVVLANEYLLTGLNPFHYDCYNRNLIIKTLSEWGWIGEGAKPTWLLDE